MRNNQPVTQREISLAPSQKLISTTDTQGGITYCNEAFVELSGYTKKELIGQSHTLLRHPDMPKAPFKDLWETLSAGKKWNGYVKNLSKDGSHYWVYATAVPNIRNGILAAFILGFVTSFNQVPVSLFLTGPGITTLPIDMLSSMEFVYDPSIAALSALMALMSMAIVLVAERLLGLSRYV